MNTANLQLEGLYLVIAAMHEKLISKGVVSREEVDDAMRAAEQTAHGKRNRRGWRGTILHRAGPAGRIRQATLPRGQLGCRCRA